MILTAVCVFLLFALCVAIISIQRAELKAARVRISNLQKVVKAEQESYSHLVTEFNLLRQNYDNLKEAIKKKAAEGKKKKVLPRAEYK